jgi:hypothetical protein
MKPILTTAFFLLTFASSVFAQSLIPEAAVPPTFNESGDPLTNIIDMDGAKQGKWFYQDIHGQQILMEEYTNNTLVKQYYPLIHSNGAVEWEDPMEWTSYPIAADKLRSFLHTTHGELNGDQQLVCIINSNAELIYFFALGNWDENTVNNLEQSFRTFVDNTKLSISDDTFIIL